MVGGPPPTLIILLLQENNEKYIRLIDKMLLSHMGKARNVNER